MTDSNATAGRKTGKKKQIDFIVTTSDPNSESNAANKKRVRSVAALKSWPERRKKIFEQLENSGSGQGAFLLNEQQTTRRKSKTPPKTVQFVQQQFSPPSTGSAPKRAKVYGPPPPATRVGSISYGLNPDAPTFIPTTGSTAGDLSTHLDNAIEKRSPAIGSSMKLYRNFFTTLVPPPGREVPEPSDTSLVPARKKRMADGSEKPMEFIGDMAMITPPTSPTAGASSHQIDPFNNYPVKYKPWFDMILHHMITVYAPRGWPALKITDEQGVKWEWFMTQNALAEPALFYVRLLFGSGDMIRLGALGPEVMYWLRAEAIKAINEALGDSKRNCSDGLILAVGRIALHEHMYGDKFASSHVHRPAQRRMIDMRGGMKALQFPDLVKRLMRWSDRIMAVGSGTERLLEDDETNPNFSLKQSVGAIERWAPHEMLGVRSKIRISDLVNDEDET
ncbi:hypothetical protein Slin15195_G063330 [Septoria linicola]|uniref:Uncharacterized protein n=1 Tax=Septoria linicola TaxID=215465 RepID=A0A9Q9APE1_9PEZI|nr:hypothetical protein Slin14017_G113650 [Septoria linicola]USW53014.1 hypothetical protein Slin15195_G063330 [Septoria linicola]